MWPLGVLTKKPLDNLTLALLHFDGANNSQVFTDSSPNNLVFAPENSNTGVYLSTAWSKFGSSSCFFDGASFLNYLTTNLVNQPIQPLGNDDWQMDFFIKPTDLSGLKGLFNYFIDSSRIPINLISFNDLLYLNIQTVGSASWDYIGHETTLLISNEYHIRVLRKNGVVRLFIDGVEAVAAISVGAAAIGDVNGLFQLGAAWNSIGGFTQQYAGYIDEFRFRKQAVYTGNFTPPTTPFAF